MKKIGGECGDVDKLKAKVQNLEKDLESKKELIKILGETKENKEN